MYTFPRRKTNTENTEGQSYCASQFICVSFHVFPCRQALLNNREDKENVSERLQLQLNLEETPLFLHTKYAWEAWTLVEMVTYPQLL